MQKLERYFGFKVKLEQELDAKFLGSLTKRATAIAIRYDLDPSEHYVYIHALSVVPALDHFASSTGIADKLGELRVSFLVNPKQKESGAIRFFNHLFGNSLECDVPCTSTSTSVDYFVPGEYLGENLGFHNTLVTFVSKTTRKEHRKIKVSVTAIPTKEYAKQLSSRAKATTKLDLEYEKYTPITLPRKSLGADQPDERLSAPFRWRGPSRDRDLHAFLAEEQPLDVGQMKILVAMSSGVCRIDLATEAIGTGFLIADNLVLTNFHVLEAAGSDLQEAVANVTFRFGCVTGEDGTEQPGTSFHASENPIVAASSTKDFDYVLVELDSAIRSFKEFRPLPYQIEPPSRGSSLTLIQHPRLLQNTETPMKITLNPNGVTGVYLKTGRVQYVTRASKGASGSPCVNASWKVVAIHHAEQAVKFGKRREGILMGAILNEIGSALKARIHEPTDHNGISANR
jgi:hypothetical protein